MAINQRFEDWFDPYNVEHQKAYATLMETGAWPLGFVPADVEYPALSVRSIQAKMATAWIEQCRAGHIFGMPHWDQ